MCLYHYYYYLGGYGFEELQEGDEVEFLTVFSQKAHKDSAIYVRKLRCIYNYTNQLINKKSHECAAIVFLLLTCLLDR